MASRYSGIQSLRRPQISPSVSHTRTSSWDDQTFPSYAHIFPEEKNGDWKTETANALRNPSDTAHSIADKLRPSNIYHKAASLAEEASENMSTRLNYVFSGHDAPEMFNAMVDLVPSISMPNMRQVSQSIDSLTDSAQSLTPSIRSFRSLQEEPLRNQYTFAQEMGKRARQALVEQDICKKWQIMSSRETVGWQSKLDEALMRLFRSEMTKCSVDDLFAMKPVWKPDSIENLWRLELDSGWSEIVTKPGAGSFEEVPVFLLVDFELLESFGSAKVVEVREKLMVQEEDDWLAI